MEGYRDARKAVDRALALDDTLAEAFENLSFILAAFEFRWAEAAEAIERALALAPSNGQIVATAAINAAVGCRMDEALRLSQKAIELEPLSAPVHMIRARILGWTYHDDEAAAACEKALEIAAIIGENGPLAVEAIVKTLHTTEGMTEEEALEWEFPFGQAVFQTQDSKEGPRAFAEKRKPNFQRK